MKSALLDVLACPKCKGSLVCNADGNLHHQEIMEGSLVCGDCCAEYPIVEGIPRFVGDGHYAGSFGYQWNIFRSEQIDSVNGTKLSTNRVFSETGWQSDSIRGKWILDAGCGAGRFLDVVATTGAQVIGLDISQAIDAAAKTVSGNPNVHFVQASIFEPPFKPGVLDAIYCIGVIQHTPDPVRAIKSLPKSLKGGGKLALTIYERRRFTLLNAKYLIRPLTKRLPKPVLLGLIRVSMPLLFLTTEMLFRIPVFGRLFTFLIPVANYVHEPSLSIRQRYQWAIMDTFDMLSPAFDSPQTQAEVEAALRACGMTDIKRLKNPGLNITATQSI